MIRKKVKIVLLFFPYVCLIISIALYFNIIKLKIPFNGIEVFRDMVYQPKLATQESSNKRYIDSILTIPLNNSVSLNHTKYAYKQIEYDSAIKKYVNPLEMNDLNIQRGKNRFEIFCVPCHNTDGKGKGIIITKSKLSNNEEGFPPPADLTRQSTKQLSDGRLYHILSSGQNLMFPVNFKLDSIDRWAVICYIRYLQNNNSK